MLFDAFIVGCGGFIGAALRYICSQVISSIPAGAFPLATFVINMVGSFVMGILSVVLPAFFPGSKEPLLFATTGIVGGFTTLSTLGLETVGLLPMQEGRSFYASSAFWLVACLLALLFRSPRGAAWLLQGRIEGPAHGVKMSFSREAPVSMRYKKGF